MPGFKGVKQAFPMYIRHALIRKRYRHKPGIVFVHCPKTGGSSVATAIRRGYFFSTMNIKAGVSENAGLTMAGSDDPHAPQAMHTIQMLRTSLVHYYAQMGVKFITGHFFYHESFKRLHDRGYRLVTTIRNPVDRWFSEYFYNRYKQVSHARIDQDLESYLASPQGIAKGSVLIRYLGGCRQDGDYRSRAAVEDAMESSQGFDVIGVLEQFGDFIECMKQQLNLPLVLPHKRKNPAYASDEIHQSMKRYKQSAQIRAQLEEVCKPDIQLYQHILATRKN